MAGADSVQPSTSQGAGKTHVIKNILKAESLEDYLGPGYIAIHEAIVSANSLPEGAERNSYMRYREFQKIMKDEGNRILEVMQMVMSHMGKVRNIIGCSEEDVSEVVVDCNDILLDRSSINMDVMEGIREPELVSPKLHKFVSGSWNKPKPISSPLPVPELPTLCTTRIATRPQIYFKDKIDNSHHAWLPRIKEKPNSIKPLAILVETTDQGEECYSHPYEYELDHWSPSPERLRKFKPIKPKELSKTPFFYVDNKESLDQMMKTLEGKTEIAVDLEHHSYRTFMGFTCLMQISTREEDYIIDTLALREDLYVLNEVFTKPTILKVFHGAENDIEWLQRDLSLYIVNLFDTHQAAKLLDLPRVNLAHLLQKYCNIDANKHFQLFDWRTRPIPEGALKYAREDTHYLLYVYEMMNNELISKAQGNLNLLKSVYQRSIEVCKRRYMKPILEDDSHMPLYRRGKRLFDNRQLYALKELYRWRDRTSRNLDESIGYVLPNHMMMQIAENLPREMQGILACCNPIPPVIRQSLQEIHYILLAAREQPLVKTARESGTAAPQPTTRFSLLHKWDSTNEPLRDDLPTLLDDNLPQPPEPPVVKPFIPFYEGEDDVENSKEIIKRIQSIENKKFLNPYQRYLKVLPYVNQMEQEEREREEKEYQEQRKKQKEAEVEKTNLILKQEVIKFVEPKVLPLAQQAQKRKLVDYADLMDTNKKAKKKSKKDRWKRNKMMKKGNQESVEESDGREEETKEGGGEVEEKNFEEILKVANVKEEAEREAPQPPGLPPNIHLNISEFPQYRKHCNQERDVRNREKPFVPYNYKNVDFNKFHSGDHFLKINNQSHKQKGKRKRQFGGNNLGFKNKRERR